MAAPMLVVGGMGTNMPQVFHMAPGTASACLAVPITAQSVPLMGALASGTSTTSFEAPAAKAPAGPLPTAGVVQAASTVARSGDRTEAAVDTKPPAEAKSKTVGSLLSAYDDDDDDAESADEAAVAQSKPAVASNPVLESRRFVPKRGWRDCQATCLRQAHRVRVR